MSKKRSFLIFISVCLGLITYLFLQHPTNENEQFDCYVNTLFRQEVSCNTISLSYTLDHPEHFGIKEIPISFGSFDTDITALCAAAENGLAHLASYNTETLSAENQLIHELLKHSFTLSLKLAPYTLYQEPLAPLTGVQAQLPVLLAEFSFDSEEDVETYLALLKEFPNYFQEIVTFEKTKSSEGLFMSSDRAAAVIEECHSFIQPVDTHYLHTSFKSRLSSLNLTAKQQDFYIHKNQTFLETYVFTAYENLAKELQQLLDTSQNTGGLCYFENGKFYYETLVCQKTGSAKTIPQLQELANQQIAQDFRDLQTAIRSSLENEVSASAFTTVTDPLFPDTKPATLLQSLKTKMSDSFPTPPDVKISVKYVEPSLQKYLSPAFYLIPPIDNIENNYIYINPSHMSDELSLFTTLAHEGYPGHLYQTTYFSNLEPAPIRTLLACSGYVEGWATYCEMMSYYYAPLDKSEAAILQKNASVMLGLYALADMGIHYDGWSLSDTIQFFSDYGISDANTVSEIYSLILGDPGNYLKYYIGYVEFLELKKAAIKSWGNTFTQQRFHQEILEAGPIPFDMLKQHLGVN